MLYRPPNRANSKTLTGCLQSQCSLLSCCSPTDAPVNNGTDFSPLLAAKGSASCHKITLTLNKTLTAQPNNDQESLYKSKDRWVTRQKGYSSSSSTPATTCHHARASPKGCCLPSTNIFKAFAYCQQVFQRITRGWGGYKAGLVRADLPGRALPAASSGSRERTGLQRWHGRTGRQRRHGHVPHPQWAEAAPKPTAPPVAQCMHGITPVLCLLQVLV